MKAKFTIIILLILSIIFISVQQSTAKDFNNEEIKKGLPKLLGASNAGNDFYFSIHPTPEGPGIAWEINIYITSTVKTQVTVEIDDIAFKKSQYTIPNDIIMFELYPHQGQCYRKTPYGLPEPDTVYRVHGVHVYSDAPIICYCVPRPYASADGFLALPVNALGKEYIVASFPDPSSNITQWLPSYTSIVAPYDNTRVRFILGGNNSTKTAGGMKPGDSRTWTLHQSDVLLIGSLGHYGDLTGSRIAASKPVSVISGHHCANIPIDNPYCNYLIEQELPMEIWGKEYHVTNIIGRKFNSWLRIFAKEPNTTIYKDGNYLGIIKNVGGIDGEGYLSTRADDGAARPIVITSDKPCGVTQYNTGCTEDEVYIDPFQMTLIPFELYQKEIMFNTPGIRGGDGFPHNYINLVFQAADDGRIPDDLMFAEAVKGEFVWEQLNSIDSLPGDEFSVPVNNKRYFVKAILLPHDGVYKIKANAPFGAYSYGYSYMDSYGFPSCLSIRDFYMKDKDTLPPVPSYQHDSSGLSGSYQNAKVRDMPEDDESRSNIREIVLDTDSSYNFSFSREYFMPCEDQEVSWHLIVIDLTLAARAVLNFVDCAGNDTTITINYIPYSMNIQPESYNFDTVEIGQTVEQDFYIVNEGEKYSWTLHRIKFSKEKQGFVLSNLDLPITFEPLDSVKLTVSFTATVPGSFSDEICLGDTNWYYCINGNITATVKVPDDVPGCDIGNGEIIRLYPNPADDFLNISLNNYEFKGDCNIKLYDMLGNVAMEKNAVHETDKGWFVLNTTQLSHGLYFLKINTSEQVIIRKIAIVH